MSYRDRCLSAYVEACRRALGRRTRFPSIHAPDREQVSATVYDAISQLGWPADLKGVLDMQQSVESRLDMGSGDDCATKSALIAIEIACSMRIAAEPVRSKDDARVKIAWLRAEMHLAAADEEWIDVLDDLERWLRSPR